MKIKKIVLFLAMCICAFSMTACSDGQEKVDFNYTDIDILNDSVILSLNIQMLDEATKTQINNTEGQEVFQMAISNFETANEECGTFSGFRKKDGSVLTLMDIVSASQDAQAFNECLVNMDSVVEQNGKNVKVTLVAVYSERDAEISLLYRAAPQQASLDELTQQVTIPYEVSEVTVSPEYSLKEVMSQAGMNTVMGMGTVFLVLIIIALIIGQFERISNSIMKVADAVGRVFAKRKERRAAKKAEKTAGKDAAANSQKEEAVQPAAAVADVNAANAGNLIQDAELAAVITAAIMASQGQAVSTGSDGLIVRSIKKAKR